MTNNPNKPPSAANAAIAEIAGRLHALSKDTPRALEVVAALYDSGPRDQAIAGRMLGILPHKVDADAMLSWLEGAPLPPEPLRLVHPDKGRPKGARGAHQSAMRRHDAALADLAAAKVKFEAAEAAAAAARDVLVDAEEHLRVATFARFTIAVGEQMVGPFALGPLWTLARSVSGYLQTDIAWENGLSIEGREATAEHRRKRKESHTELLRLLDTYCGDEEVEIELYEAILTVMRRIHSTVDVERDTSKYAGGKLSNRAKRTRRTSEAWRTTVHPNGKLADRHAVIEGLAGHGQPD